MMFSESAHKCFCGSEVSFKQCCEKFIHSTQYPDTPEQLMRSRYTAYVLKNEEYLLKSWDESTRPHSLDLESDTTQWTKLKIISAVESQVEFVAFFINTVNKKESLFALYEKSEFVKDKNWVYLEGKELKTTELSKNMLCPCQSGKKFKRCCEIEKP